MADESEREELEAPVDFRLEELRILAGDEYRVYVYKHVNGIYELQQKKSEFPDIDDVGREFGPGKYQVKVSYKRATTKPKENPWTFNTVTFVLGQPYAAAHREYKRQQAEANGDFDKTAQQPQQSRLESLREMVEMIGLMRGLMPQQAAQQAPGEALRDITPIITAAMGRPAPPQDDTMKILLPKLLELATSKPEQGNMAQMLDVLKTGMELGAGGQKEEGGLTGIIEALAPSLLGNLMGGQAAAPGGSAKVIDHEVVQTPKSRPKALPLPPGVNVADIAEQLRNNPDKLQQVYKQLVQAKGKEFADGIAKQYGLTIPQDAPISVSKPALVQGKLKL